MTRILLALFVFLFTLTAAAQVQPTYNRQSKSNQVQVLTATQTASAGYKSTDSNVIETTTFDAAQVLADFAPTCGGSIYVLSSLSKTGPFVLTNQSSPNSIKDITSMVLSPTFYNVGNFGPYIKFRFISMSGCPDGINISAILIPFPSSVTVQGDTSNINFPVQIGAPGLNSNIMQPLRSGAGGGLYVKEKAAGSSSQGFILSIPSASPTAVINIPGVSADDYKVTIQNQGTFPVRCGIQSSFSASDYAFSLKASSVAGDGTGGLLQFVLPNIRALNCIGIGGTSSVSVLYY